MSERAEETRMAMQRKDRWVRPTNQDTHHTAVRPSKKVISRTNIHIHGTVLLSPLSCFFSISCFEFWSAYFISQTMADTDPPNSNPHVKPICSTTQDMWLEYPIEICKESKKIQNGKNILLALKQCIVRNAHSCPYPYWVRFETLWRTYIQWPTLCDIVLHSDQPWGFMITAMKACGDWSLYWMEIVLSGLSRAVKEQAPHCSYELWTNG